jgi:hypothetical protein
MTTKTSIANELVGLMANTSVMSDTFPNLANGYHSASLQTRSALNGQK